MDNKRMLIVLALLGATIFVVAVGGLLLIASIQSIKVLASDPNYTGAWIGFWGSIVGALITLTAASVALYPSYAQMNEMKRNSAVQAGEILRKRYIAAKSEYNILLMGWGLEDV